MNLLCASSNLVVGYLNFEKINTQDVIILEIFHLHLQLMGKARVMQMMNSLSCETRFKAVSLRIVWVTLLSYRLYY